MENVYAFYEPINEPWVDQMDHNNLIELWKKSWRYYGWNPIVYGIKECESCDGYEELYNACQSYPTVNPKQYEMLCFLRWLYMSEVGGWYADLDMMNHGFYPTEFGDKIITTAYTLHCSAIYMSAEKYKKIVDHIKNLKITDEDYFDFGDGRKAPTVSDMTVLTKHNNDIDLKLEIQSEYPHNDYKNKLIVHYPFAIYGSDSNLKGKSRSQIILEDDRTKTFLK